MKIFVCCININNKKKHIFNKLRETKMKTNRKSMK